MSLTKPEFERLNRFIEQIANDVFGFVVICGVTESFRAEQICLDVISEASRVEDFQNEEMQVSPLRERILNRAFQIARKSIHPGSIGEHERFFVLPQLERATIYLRHRIGLSFVAISRILEISEGEVRNATHSAREHLLCRPMRKLDWDF